VLIRGTFSIGISRLSFTYLCHKIMGYSFFFQRSFITTHSVTDAGVFFSAHVWPRLLLYLVTVMPVLKFGHLAKVDQKCLETLETWCWRRMENISWIDSVRKRCVRESEGGVQYRTYSKKKQSN